MVIPHPQVNGIVEVELGLKLFLSNRYAKFKLHAGNERSYIAHFRHINVNIHRPKAKCELGLRLTGVMTARVCRGGGGPCVGGSTGAPRAAGQGSP